MSDLTLSPLNPTQEPFYQALDTFKALFLGVAETNPEAATRIAGALFAMARKPDRDDAMLAVCDPNDNASGCGPACSVCGAI